MIVYEDDTILGTFDQVGHECISVINLSIEPVTICDRFTLLILQIVVLNVLLIVYKGSSI